ncbi:hypothetical protein [Nocardia sp. NPDC003963]
MIRDAASGGPGAGDRTGGRAAVSDPAAFRRLTGQNWMEARQSLFGPGAGL